MLKRISLSAALGLILLSLIGAFMAVVGNLRTQVYTPAQRHFIEDNIYKNISQRAVEVNFIAPAGVLMPVSIGALDNHISVELGVRYEDREGVTLTFYDLDFAGLSFLAPALMVSFLACLAMALRLSEVRLRLEHYLLMGLGFFLFYPLLIFLASILGLTAAAVLSLLVIGGLVLVFLRKVESGPRPWVYAAFLLAVFLGLFSLGLLTRWRGLLLTAGGILLVGFFMQLAARLRAKEPASPPVSLEEGETTAVEVEPEVEVKSELEVEETAEQAMEETFEKFCPRCGRCLLPDYTFCPGCGHDERAFLGCQHCGRQHYATDRESLAFCPSCGTAF